MVSSVSGGTPYSYMNQLQGSSSVQNSAGSPKPTSNGTAGSSTSTSASSTTPAKGQLSQTVLNLLQDTSGGDAVSSLLTSSSNNNSAVSQLLGDASTDSTNPYIDMLKVSTSAAAYKAAYAAAEQKSQQAAMNNDPLKNILG